VLGVGYVAGEKLWLESKGIGFPITSNSFSEKEV
jgi:hypothetical protein